LARLTCDIAVRIAVGANPTATTTNNTLLVVGGVEYFKIFEGQKIAVIADDGASSGTLNISWMTP